jgi:rod shape-determining protein MreC
LIVLALICLVLLGIGRYTQLFSPVRQYINVFSTPFYWLTHLPRQVVHWIDENIASRFELIEENRVLLDQVLVQNAQLQKMDALAKENNRLRALMNSSKLVQDKVLVAELIGISPDPKVHKVVINKGTVDGVYEGQAVLDAFGLMGQVVGVTYNTAEVLFITDDSHAIPVQVSRNNVRTVVEGVGDLYKLRLRYVPSTMDIREGDLLVSSGLGGHFPAGYPVATVTSVSHDPGKSFATVYAQPTAQLNRSRYMLLVFSNSVISSP